MAVSERLTLEEQLRGMRRSVDPETGAILLFHPFLRGIPDRVVERQGYTLEYIGSRLLCVDVINPMSLKDTRSGSISSRDESAQEREQIRAACLADPAATD